MDVTRSGVLVNVSASNAHLFLTKDSLCACVRTCVNKQVSKQK